MQDNKDKAKAHLYLASRLRSALVAGDPNLMRMPMVRTKRGTLGSVVICVLLLGGFAVFGLIRPGGKTGWTTEGTIVTEKESGARFLYTDEALHPVLNYSSALLAGGDADQKARVSRASLAGHRRGPTIGIPGAPDALPVLADVEDAEWAVCSTNDAANEPLVSLVFGEDLGATPVEADQAMLVSLQGQEETYVVTGNRFHLIENPLAISSLGFDGVEPIDVGASWLNALAEGVPIYLPTANPPDGVEPAANQGEVFRVELVDGATRLYVALEDGLAPITEFAAALLLANVSPASSGQTSTITNLSMADVAARPTSQWVINEDEWPESVPKLADLENGDLLPCVVFDLSDEASASASLSLLSLPEDGLRTTVPNDGASDRTANEFIARPNGGTILRAEAGGEEGEAWFLISETGVKYPIPTMSELATLGFEEAEIEVAPNALLDFFPTGPGLSSEDSRLTVDVSSDRTESAKRDDLTADTSQ